MRTFEDAAAMSLEAAEAMAMSIAAAIQARGRCAIALSGGSTPRRLHRALADRFRDRIDWRGVHVFWGDERYVPHADDRSNYRMARETLLDHVPCPAPNVHPMPTSHADPETAARDYDATLRAQFGGELPRFDVNIMGLGADGHTASLFPGDTAVRERDRWVVAVRGPAEPPVRLTLTVPVLAAAAHVWFLVTGAGKAAAVQDVLSGNAEPATSAAAAIQQEAREVTWWLDRAAARGEE